MLINCEIHFLFPIGIDFFNQVNLLYGSVAEFCTAQTCPVMSAGPKYVPLFFYSSLLFPPFLSLLPLSTPLLFLYLFPFINLCFSCH